MSNQTKILVIDDEPVIIDAVVKICSSENYPVDVTASVKSGIEKISPKTINYYLRYNDAGWKWLPDT